MYTGMQVAGLVLAGAGALVTFVLSRIGRCRSPELEAGMKAAGLALAAAGALLIMI